MAKSWKRRTGEGKNSGGRTWSKCTADSELRSLDCFLCVWTHLSSVNAPRKKLKHVKYNNNREETLMTNRCPVISSPNYTERTDVV